MTLIIYAHPWEGSFNHAILTEVITKLSTAGKSYQVVDLNGENFNPVLTKNELAIYNHGEYSDPLVGKYQSLLKEADEVIFIFPIWWGTMAAILRGFFDKVLLVNFSHNYQNGWTPLLDITKTVVITTSQSPTEHFRSSIEGGFIHGTLEVVGFKNSTWLNCDNTSLGTDEHRRQFLEKVIEAI